MNFYQFDNYSMDNSANIAVAVDANMEYSLVEVEKISIGSELMQLTAFLEMLIIKSLKPPLDQSWWA